LFVQGRGIQAPWLLLGGVESLNGRPDCLHRDLLLLDLSLEMLLTLGPCGLLLFWHSAFARQAFAYPRFDHFALQAELRGFGLGVAKTDSTTQMTNAPFDPNAGADVQRSGASLSVGLSYYF